MKRLFVETEIFQEDIKRLKIPLEQVRQLQNELLKNREKGNLISGTGGTRKVRVSSLGNKGKSGGYRALYTDFKDSEVIYFWTLFGKDEQDNLTSNQKSWIKAMNLEISKELKNRKSQYE